MAFSFSTTAGVGVGTISIARNSTTVTGVGTNFQSPSLVNQIILVNGFNSRVTAVASATSMTINRVPSFEITGDTFSFVTAATVINQTGADTDPSGLSALLGVNTYRVGIQAVYDLGVLRLALTGSAATFSYDANRHCIVWSNQVSAIELTIGSGRTLTITGARTDGTYTAPFYPRALAMPRVLPAGDSTFLPAHRSLVNSGVLNISGVWLDTNQVDDLGGTATITECKWSSTDQQANFRLSAANVTINGLDLHNMPLTLLQSGTALNGIRFYNSGYTPVSLPAVAATNPRVYTDWNFLGALPLMNNFSGNANYVEFRNFGDWAGFKLATNSAVNMAARFVKNVSVNVIDTLGAGVTGAIVYRLDTNNGSRVTYTADEHFIQTTASGVATGRILAQIGRLPAGAANNSTQYTAFMDCRNAANDQTGNDVLRYVSYEHLLANRNVNTKGIGELISEQTLFDDPSITLDKAAAIAKLASSFIINPTTEVITVTANSSFDDLYDAIKAYKATANAINLSTPTLDSLILTPSGANLVAFNGWELIVNNGVTLNRGEKFEKIQFTNVTLNGTAKITGLYQTSQGTSTIFTFGREEAPIPNGCSLAIWDNDGNTLFFESDTTEDTYSFYIPPMSTEIPYNFAVERYGFRRFAGSFPSNAGEELRAAIVFNDDIGITELDLSAVQAYTILDTLNNVYDSIANYRLSENGIKSGDIIQRDGLFLDFLDRDVIFNDQATSIVQVSNGTLTLRGLVVNSTATYTSAKTLPPATIESTDDEQLNFLIEDANGDSQLTVLGGDNESYELWKVPVTTATDDYETGELLITLPNNLTPFRFIGITGFDIVGRDTSSGVRRRSSMTKGVYTQAFYVGNEIQLATDAPQLIENNTLLESLIVELASIKGSGWASASDTLRQISLRDAQTHVKIDNLGQPLQADDYVAPDNVTIGQIKTKVDTLENTDLTGIALEATNQEILTAIDNIPATDLTSIETDLEIINEGVKKASLLIPHTTDL
jgi:hypothetical protein